jgi:hypothetical protein
MTDACTCTLRTDGVYAVLCEDAPEQNKIYSLAYNKKRPKLPTDECFGSGSRQAKLSPQKRQKFFWSLKVLLRV